MDENTAWKNFVETGRVSDYLDYCRLKLGYPPQEVHDDREVPYENGHGRTDPEGPDRWR